MLLIRRENKPIFYRRKRFFAVYISGRNYMARGDVTMLICYPTGGDNVGAKLKNIVGRFSSEISTVSRISIRDKYRGNHYGGERSKVSRFVNASSAFVRKFRFVNKMNGEYLREVTVLFSIFSRRFPFSLGKIVSLPYQREFHS